MIYLRLIGAKTKSHSITLTRNLMARPQHTIFPSPEQAATQRSPPAPRGWACLGQWYGIAERDVRFRSASTPSAPLFRGPGRGEVE